MNKLAAVALVLLFCTPAFSKEFRCSDHQHFLLLEESGFEHVNHRLLLNGKVLIKELEEALWFIEAVSCTTEGFNLVASHIQYGDPTKESFVLKVMSARRYKINEGI